MTANLKKLLVVDNDFQEYNTPKALESAIERLRQENIVWHFNQIIQDKSLATLNKRNYDAILIDNDHGEGISTLYLARLKNKDIPIAYVSAYSKIGLKMQHKHLKTAKFIDPDDFEKLGITLIQKAGKNISKDVSSLALENELYSFLKESSDKSKIPNRKHLFLIKRNLI